MGISVRWRSWNGLSKKELYDLIQLRLAVFCVEQNCPYQDLDGLDKQAMHLLAYNDGKLIGYLRLFESLEQYYGLASIGRVCTEQSMRKQGLARDMMQLALSYSDKHFAKNIKISAQKYLEDFYASLDFVTVTEPYLEDGIPHIGMIRQYEDNDA
ncbi:GNAT family N-acetyltransferase [Kangiella aquimarina]|uniref:GNAT family N-acetyltransferase n=1 Tax=Kangiella aquimarina TaxID=261965 RepID=A0ABZ0X4L8_9GAMM|nr:GNAT family N-acetyltransferase [Kangiella aquimarina]WQG85551.1 GNAT family N-acetyltransferase [Kangiella aquimarina]